MRSEISAASSCAVSSRRLSGPNPPKGIRTTCSTTAAAYALATKARSTGPLRRPVGNARNRCRNSTGGKRSNAWPRVNVKSLVVHESVEMKFAKPTATISGPNRLGPPPPREGAAKDVGRGEPIREQGDHERLPQLGSDRGIAECRSERVRRSRATGLGRWRRAQVDAASLARRPVQPRAVLWRERPCCLPVLSSVSTTILRSRPRLQALRVSTRSGTARTLCGPSRSQLSVIPSMRAVC